MFGSRPSGGRRRAVNGATHLLATWGIAGFVLINPFELVLDLVPSFLRVQVVVQRQVGLGHKIEATVGLHDCLVSIDAAAEGLDGDEKERGRGEQSRREQTATGMAGGVANAQPGHTP